MRWTVFFSLALLVGPLGAAPEYPRMGPDIFDPKADGEKLVQAALVQAKREDKRVLLLFGANWCPWCRRLHKALASASAVTERLHRSFVWVSIDANTRNDKERNAALIARYGDPLQFGLPVFVILDPDGKQLTTRESQSFAAETDQITADRLRTFLDQWAN